jgi:hypothetical protein
MSSFFDNCRTFLSRNLINLPDVEVDLIFLNSKSQAITFLSKSRPVENSESSAMED